VSPSTPAASRPLTPFPAERFGLRTRLPEAVRHLCGRFVFPRSPTTFRGSTAGSWHPVAMCLWVPGRRPARCDPVSRPTGRLRPVGPGN
jgi:hypothetical protein